MHNLSGRSPPPPPPPPPRKTKMEWLGDPERLRWSGWVTRKDPGGRGPPPGNSVGRQWPGPLHCAARQQLVLRNCRFNCRAGQSHKDNICRTAVEEQRKQKTNQSIFVSGLGRLRQSLRLADQHLGLGRSLEQGPGRLPGDHWPRSFQSDLAWTRKWQSHDFFVTVQAAHLPHSLDLQRADKWLYLSLLIQCRSGFTGLVLVLKNGQPPRYRQFYD